MELESVGLERRGRGRRRTTPAKGGVLWRPLSVKSRRTCSALDGGSDSGGIISFSLPPRLLVVVVGVFTEAFGGALVNEVLDGSLAFHLSFPWRSRLPYVPQTFSEACACHGMRER